MILTTDTFIGTATITYLLSIVCFILAHTGLETFYLSSAVTEARETCQGALLRCKHPNWVLNRLKIKSNYKHTTQAQKHFKHQQHQHQQPQHYSYGGTLHKGLSKSPNIICGKLGIQVHFKRGYTIRGLLVAPKDKDNFTQKSGVIYKY